MAISATLHTQKNLETHQNRLSRFFQQHSQPGQPAQAAPGGEYHTGLAGFPLADGAFAGTVAKLAMRQPFVLFKGLTFQKLCLPGAFR
ncbi:hypothetical protein K5725_24490, partial [Salmonella enterica]|nr:hypothetical protein [Salmonella enterica]